MTSQRPFSPSRTIRASKSVPFIIPSIKMYSKNISATFQPLFIQVRLPEPKLPIETRALIVLPSLVNVPFICPRLQSAADTVRVNNVWMGQCCTAPKWKCRLLHGCRLRGECQASFYRVSRRGIEREEDAYGKTFVLSSWDMERRQKRQEGKN